MNKVKLLTLTSVILLMAFALVGAAIADSNQSDPPPVSEAAPGSQVESLSGSYVVFDPSIGGDVCYLPGASQTFCFRAESFSPDYEYVYNLWEKFPANWTVNNVFVAGTPWCDNGSWGSFSWSFQTSPYEVNINHARYQGSGGAHCIAYYCFEVTSGTGTPNALESWFYDGDGYASPPHWPCSNDGYAPTGFTCDEAVLPQASVPPCAVDGPDLSTSSKDAPPTVPMTDPIHYILTIQNTGNQPALEAALADVIPADTDFIPGSLEWSSGNAWFDVGMDTVYWEGTVTTDTLSSACGVTGLPVSEPQAPTGPGVTGAAPAPDDGGVSSLSGSYVAFDPSVGGDTCFIPGAPQTFCFKAESYTTDWEYVYNVWQRFPTDWTVNNVYVQGTPACTGGGTWGAFTWSFQTSPYEVNIDHDRYQANPNDDCVAYYCFEVVAGTGAPDAAESWYWDGDGYGAGPHNPCSSDSYTPAGQTACDEATQPLAAIPPCSIDPGVFLLPPDLYVEGCNGVPQMHTLTVLNNTGVDYTFDLFYDVITGTAEIWGPADIYVADGTSAQFEVGLNPDNCELEEVVGIVEVQDPSATWVDFSLIHQTITSEPSWAQIPASAPSWAGLGYPRDGCTAQNAAGEWVTYLIGDTSGIFGFWGYNHDTNTWYQPAPTGLPADRWAPDWAYDPDTNKCYMTGGANTPGGGTYAEAFVFDPVANTFTQLGSFTNMRDFHNSWVGTIDGTRYLCIGGGVNASSVIQQSTQCYDVAQAAPGVWNAENAQMAAFPTDPFGAADAILHAPTGDQFWYVGGAINAFATVTDEARYWDDADNAWHFAGNTGVPRYRVEGDFLNGNFFQLGGSSGGFTPTTDAVMGWYDGANWVFSVLPNMANARMDNVVGLTNDSVWSVDGYGVSNAAYVEVLAFCPACLPAANPVVVEFDVALEPGVCQTTIYNEATITDPAMPYAVTVDAETLVGECLPPDIVVNAPPLHSTQLPDTQNTIPFEICNVGYSPLSWSLDEIPDMRSLRDGPIGPSALGDWLFDINAESATADNQLLGVEFVDGYYWITGGNSSADPNKLYVLDLSGTLVATYDQASDPGWGWRDLAYDGTYLYASDSGVIEEIDPATGAATGVTIPSPLNPARALAYDPATDHFWTANWDSTIYEFDRTGAIINSFPAVGLSTYGMAWDSFSAGGPYLWLWSQDGPDPLLLASQLDPTTGLLTGVTFLGSGVAGEMAGGATITDQVVPGYATFLGLNQGATDRVGVYELAVSYTDDIPWLSEDPISGNIDPQTCVFVDTLFDSAGMAFGDYYGDLGINSNDPDTPSVVLPVQLTVVGEPDIDITAPPLDAVLYPDQQTTISFDICNLGNGDLTWDLAEVPGALNIITHAAPSVPSVSQPVELTLTGSGGPASPTAEWNPDADVLLQLDDGSRDNDIGLGGTIEMLWVNRFTPDPTLFPFFLDEISVYFSTVGLVNIGDDMVLVLYENTSGNADPAVGSNFLASFPVTVQALDAWNTYVLPAPVNFMGPGDVVVGLIGMETPGTSYWPASMDQTATQERSWAGWWNASPPPTPPTLPPENWTLIDAYFPGNWMVRAAGETLVTDVPWVSEDPLSGTLTPGSCVTVDVTFDSTGLPLGLYEASLDITSNDPDEPLINLPISLEVIEEILNYFVYLPFTWKVSP